MLNGSSHINGTTMAALTEVGKLQSRLVNSWWQFIAIFSRKDLCIHNNTVSTMWHLQ